MAQDNAAQAIKDLQKNLKELDSQLVRSQEGVAKIGELIQKAMTSASGSVDGFLKQFREKIGAVKGEKLRLAVEFVGKNGQSIENAIKQLEGAIDKRAKKIDIFGESIKGAEAIKQKYRELLEMQKMMQDPAKFYDQMLGIVNKASGGARANQGTALGRARATEMNKVRNTMNEINKLIEQRTKLEANLGKEGRTEQYYERQKKGIESINQEIEKYKRTLASLGGRGRQALSALGGDGSATALKKQEQNFRTLNKLLNERRKLNAEIQANGGKATEIQARYQNVLNNAIQETVQSMRDLGKQYEGVTRQAAKNTMVERTKKTKNTIDKLNGSLVKTKTTLSSMLPILQRLGSAFGIYFSARSLVQFGKKLIETRGEFEMQFVAMKQIIGDVDAATKIWSQTMQQALQSPFKAMQLVTYTKQLAAYRIETEKLFETTKRLADVSAGLGVDMGRLILAYGQVKAANYLRASEIRQFTEAGVNILGELAKYFTEIEGRAVSTAQVMERVTKRMVEFKDVEEIFKRMTDEGGTFFNMQEVQADTVRGQIMKLHDAYDQMLNTIGQSNQGAIRNFIGALNNMVKNWKTIVSVIKVATGLFITWKIVQITAGVQMLKTAKDATIESMGVSGLTAKIIQLIAAEKTATKTTLTFSNALKKLGSGGKGGWIGVIVSLLITLAVAIADAYKRAHELTNELNKITAENQMQQRKSISDYERMANSIRDVNTSEKERQETLSKMKRMYEDILPARMLEIEYITKEGNAYDDAKESIIAYYEEKRRQEQIDKVYEKYGETVTKKESKLFDVIHSIAHDWGTELSKPEIDEIINELTDRFKEGIVTADNYYESLKEIMSVVSGFDLSGKLVSDITYDLGGGTISEEGSATKLQDAITEYFEALTVLDKEIEEVNGSTTEFGHTLKDALNADVFQEAERQIQQEISSLKASGISMTFNEELDYMLEHLPQKYAELFERFKETNEQYQRNPPYTSDLFDRLFGRRLSEQGLKKEIDGTFNVIKYSIVDNQKAINEEIETLANQTGIGNREILRQFQLDTDMELDKWIEKQLAKIELYKTDILRIQKGLTSGMTAEHIQELQILEPFLPLWEIYLKGLTPSKKTKDSSSHKSISTLISLLKEMNGEYDKLSKSAYGYARAQQKVTESFSDSFKEIFGFLGIDISQADTWSKKGLADTMKMVIDRMDRMGAWGRFGANGGKEARDAFMKAWSQAASEVDIEMSVRLREDFGKQIERAFSDYELTLELQKLNIPTSAARNLFSEFNSQSLGSLQDALQEFYRSQGENFDEEDLKVYKQWADKIEAEILKMRKERAKEYSKFLEKEYSDRAKLEMQYAKDVAFVTANFKGEQQQNILKGLDDKYQKDINELTWKSFKESAFYVEMMDDLSSIPAEYMKIMLGKIEELLENPETLSPRALKEAINARQKILEAQMDINSLAVMRQSTQDIREAANDVGGTTWMQTKKRLDEEQQAQAERLDGIEREIRANETLQGQLKGLEDVQQAEANARAALSSETNVELGELEDAQSLINEYQASLAVKTSQLENSADANSDSNAALEREISDLRIAIALLEEYNRAKQGRIAYEGTTEGQAAVAAQMGGQTSTSVGTRITRQRGEANNIQNRLSQLKQWQKAFKNFADSMAKWNGALADTINKIGSMGSAFYDTFEALGGETDALTEGWKEFGDTMVQTITQALALIPQLVTGFVTAGTSINAALGIIGLIAEAIQLVIVLIGALAKLHDAGYEAEIERQQEKIDALERAYSRLEKQIEKTWDTASYIRTYNAELQNAYLRIEALNAQIAAEEAKKNSDDDKIQGYKDSIVDLEDELDELKQKQIEVFGGIGESEYYNAAQEFVNAWKSAFLETGDGLQGLQDHFDEFLNDWFVKQATMRIAGGMLEPLFRQIDQAVDRYSSGGANVLMNELDAIREKFGIIAPDLSSVLTELAGLWGVQGEGGLSGLAAGIQGMTEEQANILEAYWNSVRGYTASIDANVATIVSILSANYGGRGDLSGSIDSNPMIQQMTLIAQNTRSIDTLLHSVTKSGHTMGGSGIKVFLN